MSTATCSRMVHVRAGDRVWVFLLLVVLCCVYVALGFSDGTKLSRGSSAARRIYCNRPPNRRGPLHFHQRCNGFCQPRQDLETFFSVNVSSPTYWLGTVTVNISAKLGSGKSVTGFSVYAYDENEHVAGSFVEDGTDVIVGSCNDVISITDETHGAFHKMANPGRKNVSVVWQPDGYNHGKVKFVLWVVNNHSDVYWTESKWLTSEKHGSDPLDVASNLQNILSTVDMEAFERSFQYRSTKGYQLDLTNPFSPFSKSPSKIELVPVNISDSSQTRQPAAPITPTTKVVTSNATSGSLSSGDRSNSSIITKDKSSTTNSININFTIILDGVDSNKTNYNNMELKNSSNNSNNIDGNNDDISNMARIKDLAMTGEDRKEKLKPVSISQPSEYKLPTSTNIPNNINTTTINATTVNATSMDIPFSIGLNIPKSTTNNNNSDSSVLVEAPTTGPSTSDTTALLTGPSTSNVTAQTPGSSTTDTKELLTAPSTFNVTQETPGPTTSDTTPLLSGPSTSEPTPLLSGPSTSDPIALLSGRSSSEPTTLLSGPSTSRVPTSTGAPNTSDSTYSTNAYLNTLATDTPATQTAAALPTGGSTMLNPTTAVNVSDSML